MPGEEAPADGPALRAEGLGAPTARRAEGVETRTSNEARGREAKLSPKARRLAREQGIDIDRLHGSGPSGEILASDVLAAAESKGTAGSGVPASAGGMEPLSSIARLMAERTTQSWTSVPHFFVLREVDAAALVEARKRLDAKVERAKGVRLTHTDLLIALVARTLARHPRMNASWNGDGIRNNRDVNIGVAMAVEGGVVAPAIQNADTADLGEIAVQRRDLAERAKANKLRPTDISGATFTLSNLGMYGVDAFTAIINRPQAGILAVGRIADRIVPVDGQPGIRPMMTLTLSCDHRVVDGVRAAEFLNDLAKSIGDAGNLL